MNPVQIYRIARWFHLRGFGCVARFFKALNFLVFKCVIPPECLIGTGTRLFHSGLGIIIHPATKIGSNCNLYNFIVIGGGHSEPDGPPISITIGDGCSISAGAKILCREDSLTLGNNCVVAANAVVVHSFPDDVVIGGIPAKVLKYRN